MHSFTTQTLEDNWSGVCALQWVHCGKSSGQNWSTSERIYWTQGLAVTHDLLIVQVVADVGQDCAPSISGHSPLSTDCSPLKLLLESWVSSGSGDLSPGWWLAWLVSSSLPSVWSSMTGCSTLLPTPPLTPISVKLLSLPTCCSSPVTDKPNWVCARLSA